MMSLMCSTCLWPKQLSSYDTISTCNTYSILENISILVPRHAGSEEIGNENIYLATLWPGLILLIGVRLYHALIYMHT